MPATHARKLIRPGLSDVALAAGMAAFLLLPASAFAADAAKEVQTAATHAGYAADATVLKTAITHLHHTVNCLVGPKGAGFDAKELNPCKDQGAGAISDTTDAAKKKNLEAALASANRGLKATTLAAAKTEAQNTAALLKKAE